MIRTVKQRDLDVHDREAGKHAGLHRTLDALFDRRNVFLRNRAANGLVDELKALAAFVGFHLDLDMAVLALAAGLSGVLGLLEDRFRNRLLIGDLRRADIGLHLELPQ